MAETTATPQPYITNENDIFEVLNSMERTVFNNTVNVGLCLFNSCSSLLVGEQKPYAKELFEDNEINKRMWIRILRNLGLFETHKFEIKQYLKNGTPQFHEDGSPMMLVFIKPKHSSGGSGHKKSPPSDKTSK
jgi:hypothetical protein